MVGLLAIFFTSDLHLGHENVITSCGRNYATVDEMNDNLIDRWNAKVSENDEVYILGDLSYRSPVHISSYLKRMAGKKHLLIGNHDIKWLKNLTDTGEYFESVEYMSVIKEGKNLITLCHYPMLEWNRSRYAEYQEGSTSWLIHGHIHNSRTCDAYDFIKEKLPCALNAGVDINNYEPVTFEELLENNSRWYGRI